MARTWVQALVVINRHDELGAPIRHYKGDWFPCRGRELAQLLSQSKVALPGHSHPVQTAQVGEVGIVTESASTALKGAKCEISYVPGLTLPYEKTLIYRDGPIRPELIPVAFGLLDSWELLVPLWTFSEDATMIGTEKDRALTREVIGELRVPVYDTRQLYALRCPAVERLFKTWEVEKDKLPEGDERLAFLRALYVTPMLILALPPSWSVKDAL